MDESMSVGGLFSLIDLLASIWSCCRCFLFVGGQHDNLSVDCFSVKTLQLVGLSYYIALQNCHGAKLVSENVSLSVLNCVEMLNLRGVHLKDHKLHRSGPIEQQVSQ